MARTSKKTTTQAKSRPSYKAFHVTDGEQSFWTEIGAMWDHQDGKGFTLDLELIPVKDGRIVLRQYDAKQESAEEKKAA